MHCDQVQLRDVLKRNRLQQKHIAEALGVSRVAVWNWVHGHSVPNGRHLVALVDFLRRFEPGVEVTDLLRVG